jgi:hypothetical protein
VYKLHIFDIPSFFVKLFLTFLESILTFVHIKQMNKVYFILIINILRNILLY